MNNMFRMNYNFDFIISNIDFITLTASGGPFLNTPLGNFENIKPKDAIKHPVWKMGEKISVDLSLIHI